MDEIYQRADGFLLGRRTYEIFAGSVLRADSATCPRAESGLLTYANSAL
jgi:hypothetical protein